MRISFRYFGTITRLDELRAAAAFVEDAVQQHSTTIRASFPDERDLSEEDREQMLVELRRTEEIFPQTLRRSLFVTCVSMLEDDLEIMCSDFVRRNQLSLRTSDLNGRGILRSQAFLKKVVGVPFPDTSTEWDSIKRMAELRNIIVHRGGRLHASGDENLRRFIESSEGLTTKRASVLIQASFFPDVVSTIAAFWALYSNLGYSV